MLLFTDGCDLYTLRADIAARWDYVNLPTSVAYITTSSTLGRFGGRCLTAATSTVEPMLGKTISPPAGDSTSNKIYVSVARYFQTLGAATTTYAGIIILQPVQNTSNPLAFAHVSLQYVAGGSLRVIRGDNVSIATTASAVLSAGTWHRIEMEAYIHDTAGTVIVRVDGAIVINFTGDTREGALAANVGTVLFTNQHSTNVTSERWEDFAIWTSGGDAPTGFIGDFSIETLFPDLNGTTVNGTPAPGGSIAYQTVDELGVHDGDSSYMLNATAGNIDLFHVANLNATATVHGVNVITSVRGDAPGLRVIAAALRTNSANYFGSNQNVPSQAAYVTKSGSFGLNPNTGLAWTVAQINDLQVGYKLVS